MIRINITLMSLLVCCVWLSLHGDFIPDHLQETPMCAEETTGQGSDASGTQDTSGNQ